MSERRVYGQNQGPAWFQRSREVWGALDPYPRIKWGVPVGVGLAALGYGTNQLQNMAAGDGLDQERNGWAQAASTLGNAALYGLGAAYVSPEFMGSAAGAGTVGALIGGLANNNDIRRKEIQRDTAEVAIANDGNLTPWYRNAGMIAGIAGGATAGLGAASLTGISPGQAEVPGMIAGGLVGGYLFRPQKRDYAWGEMPETFQDQ